MKKNELSRKISAGILNPCGIAVEASALNFTESDSCWGFLMAGFADTLNHVRDNNMKYQALEALKKSIEATIEELSPYFVKA